MQNITSLFGTKWENAKSSLWFLPSFLITGAFILALSLLQVDQIYSDDVIRNIPWLFSGTPDAARSLLATIASSVITVISIAISLTIVAIQQASVYYTPRILRTFTSNKGNQLVLGTYVATFVYSLLILRAIRSADESVQGFVPTVSVTVAILLALICMGLLIYFINHVAQSLQASTIVDRVHRELLEQIDDLYPENIGKSHAAIEADLGFPKDHKGQVVRSPRAGFILRINEQELAKLDLGKIKWLSVYPKVGDFVVYNEVVVQVDASIRLSDEMIDQIQDVFVIAEQRSSEQDAFYPIRQFVDIALKGLSPGINDPTTANYCIRYLGDGLCRLAQRDFPSSVRAFDHGDAKIYLNKPTWEEFVFGSYRQIIHQAVRMEQVVLVVLQSLDRIVVQLPYASRTEPISQLVGEIEEGIDTQTYSQSDKKRVQQEIAKLRRKINQQNNSSL